MAQAWDNEYRYIIHMRDHFTKFSWAKAIKQKTAKSVAKFVYKIFLMFGPPTILQCDNGMEFSSLMSHLEELWPSLKIIHGRPRHPQSQGMVERGNAIMEKKIARWMETYRRTDWTNALGLIVYTMNCEVSRTTKLCPYELVFGVAPKKDKILLDELFEAGVTEEHQTEDIEIENIESEGDLTNSDNELENEDDVELINRNEFEDENEGKQNQLLVVY